MSAAAARAARSALLALVVAGALSAAGCSKDTYLEIRFVGSVPQAIDGIRVTLTLAVPAGAQTAPMSTGIVYRCTGATTVDGGVCPHQAITLPSSMAFKLDSQTGALHIDADALDSTGASLATGHADTNIQQGKTWTVDVSLGGGADGGVDADAASADDGAVDAIDDGGLITVTDSGMGANNTTCTSYSIDASESVSLDYDTTNGMTGTPGNQLWATNNQYVGWLKFPLPRETRAGAAAPTVMSATLNLTLMSSSGADAKLQIVYSSFTGWLRATATTANLVRGAALSDSFGPGTMVFPLYASDQRDWSADLINGNITMGVANVVGSPDKVSEVHYAGVDKTMPKVANRPTLAMTICH